MKIPGKTDEDITLEFHNLLFGVRRSIRYHNRRERFFDWVNKATTFLSALSGSATIVSVLAALPKAWSVTFAVIVTVSSAIDLVIGTAAAARKHNDLAKRFIDLEKDIISSGQDEEEFKRLSAARLDIEADEPPALKVLDTVCHNELAHAMGFDRSEEYEVKWYQRLAMHFFDINEAMLRQKSP